MRIVEEWDVLWGGVAKLRARNWQVNMELIASKGSALPRLVDTAGIHPYQAVPIGLRELAAFAYIRTDKVRIVFAKDDHEEQVGTRACREGKGRLGA